MSSSNGMYGSETLNNEIFGKQPPVCKLQKDIDTILAKFSPERKCGPKVQETLNRISSISETLVSLSGETRAEIINLYMETVTANHLSKYSQQVAVLESHQRNRVASILGASNDENFSQVA